MAEELADEMAMEKGQLVSLMSRLCRPQPFFQSAAQSLARAPVGQRILSPKVLSLDNMATDILSILLGCLIQLRFQLHLLHFIICLSPLSRDWF